MEQAVGPEGLGTNLAELQNSRNDARNPSAQQPPQLQPASSSAQTQAIAKRYARVKIALGIAGTFIFFALTILLVATNATRILEKLVRTLVENDYLALLLFAAGLGLVETVLTFPLKLYSGFYLEHKYRLSNQTFRAWVWEGTKGMLIGVLLGTPILLALYFCLRSMGDLWWLPVGAILFLFSIVLARLAPILIFPLFHKFKSLENGELRDGILDLCHKVGMSVQGVFVFDMSKNTKKANAAFTGIGKSKRIILGDTLVANFTNEEIETIFAHEVGHHKLKHIWMMLVMGTINTFLGLYLTAEAYRASLAWFGFSSIDQIAALPLLGLWLGVYSLITGPLSNMLSRSHERAADRFAIATSGNKAAFVNALRKLATINLADMAPHPMIEFLFHGHPSIEKRIKAVERM
ncbi:MAG: M48 family metallopeptidase [Bacteroidota bacterium]